MSNFDAVTSRIMSRGALSRGFSTMGDWLRERGTHLVRCALRGCLRNPLRRLNDGLLRDLGLGRTDVSAITRLRRSRRQPGRGINAAALLDRIHNNFERA